MSRPIGDFRMGFEQRSPGECDGKWPGPGWGPLELAWTGRAMTSELRPDEKQPGPRRQVVSRMGSADSKCQGRAVGLGVTGWR